MQKTEQGPGHAGMLANQVPKAAITALRGLTCCGCDRCLAKAIAAALNAWPGMSEENRNGFSFTPLPHGTAFRYTVLILPLPTEASDE